MSPALAAQRATAPESPSRPPISSSPTFGSLLGFLGMTDAIFFAVEATTAGPDAIAANTEKARQSIARALEAV
jgi:FMN-dependent NADH-azoreductase